MSKPRKAAILAFLAGLGLVALQLVFGVQTGLTGLFVTGLAGGLLLADSTGRGPRGPKPPG